MSNLYSTQDSDDSEFYFKPRTLGDSNLYLKPRYLDEKPNLEELSLNYLYESSSKLSSPRSLSTEFFEDDIYAHPTNMLNNTYKKQSSRIKMSFIPSTGLDSDDLILEQYPTHCWKIIQQVYIRM